MKKIGIFALMVLVITAVVGYYFYNQNRTTGEPQDTKGVVEEAVVMEPLSDSKSRITKKPFGIFVTPQESPIQPEKFRGYHTGTDFEVTEQEINKPVAVSAICEGQIINKENVSGYGGVMVQSCTILGKTVNVIYGHLNIEGSEAKQAGSVVKRGEFIANLGADNSNQTAGERKHLHLGIFRGGQVDYRGYVEEKSELAGWLNFEDLWKE